MAVEPNAEWTVYAAKVEPERWIDKLDELLDAAAHDCRAFARVVNDAKLGEWWASYASSWPAFCRERLHREPEFIEAVVLGAQSLGFDAPIPEHVALEAGQRVRAAALDPKVGKVLGRGQPPKATEEMPDSSIKQATRAKATGVSRDTQQKLDALSKKAPALLAKVRAGEMSCHAAAVQAGIVKATWNAPVDVHALAQAVAKRYPGWQLSEVLR